MEKFYRFANVELAVRIDDDRMYEDDLQLTPFRTEAVGNAHHFAVASAEELPPPAGEELGAHPSYRIYSIPGGYARYMGAVSDGTDGAYICAEHRDRAHTVTIRRDQAPGRISARQVLNALDVEHLVASENGVILHASYIEWQGRAILFTAPSETGKSTQAELWKTHRNARIINGDRAAVIVRDGQLCAAGLPFSGSSRYCENVTVPLAAVVYLRQAPVTSIRRLRAAEGFRRVWEGCCVNTWNREDIGRTTSLVERLLTQVPVYELACTPDESAVSALEAQIRKQVAL